MKQIIQFEEGWSVIEKQIAERVMILEAHPDAPIGSDKHMNLYTLIYGMCTQSPPNNYSYQLYDKYGKVFESYCASIVLPSLRDKHGEVLLRAFVDRWCRFKIMARWMTHLFQYLECYFSRTKSVPAGLKEVALNCFCQLVYKEIGGNVKDAVVGLIRKQLEGEQIDSVLLKHVMDSFSEIGLPASELDFGGQYLAEAVNSIKL